MRCSRCGGTMTQEKFDHSTGNFFGWKCILCGEVIDQVILLNRTKQSLGNHQIRKGKYSR